MQTGQPPFRTDPTLLKNLLTQVEQGQTAASGLSAWMGLGRWPDPGTDRQYFEGLSHRRSYDIGR